MPHSLEQAFFNCSKPASVARSLSVTYLLLTPICEHNLSHTPKNKGTISPKQTHCHKPWTPHGGVRRPPGEASHAALFLGGFINSVMSIHFTLSRKKKTQWLWGFLTKCQAWQGIHLPSRVLEKFYPKPVGTVKRITYKAQRDESWIET